MDNRILVQIVAIFMYILAVVIVVLGFFPDLIGLHSALLIPCFAAALILISVGLLATDVSGMKSEMLKVSAAAGDAETARKYMEIQTSLMAMMAQNNGIDRDVLNSLLGEVGLEIPADKNEDGATTA